MFELLPEHLAGQRCRESTGKKLGGTRGHRCVHDLNVWLQCFKVFVEVVARFSPEAVPGMMAYMISIIRASQECKEAHG